MAFPHQPRALITGAGSGFGRALALHLARREGRILAADLNPATAEETAHLVHDAGGIAEPFACNVSQASDLERAAVDVERLWGGVDILVNNAGVAAAGRVGDQPMEDWEWVMSINLLGVIHGCHVFVPRFRRRKAGYILNVAAAAGFVSLPEMAAYNVTKAGVIALSETLYGELGPDNVHVTVACPSFFKTNLMDTFRSPEERQRTIAQNLFNRSTMTAEEVAAAAWKAVESGALYSIPQMDARLIWRLKRLSPTLYFRILRKRFYSGMVERQLYKA